MENSEAPSGRVVLGDPVPWFDAPLIADGSFSLQVAAGRWIVLSFLGSPEDPRAQTELAEILRDTQFFDPDKILFYGVLTAQPAEPKFYDDLRTPAISFIADYDGDISRAFGAAATPRTIVLDPMLRAVADIPWDYASGHAQAVRGVLQSLP